MARTAVAERRPQPPAPAPRSRRLVSYVVAGVLAVLVVGAAGWWLNNLVNPTPTVHATTTESFTGKIVQLERNGGEAGCVIPDGTTRRVCSVIANVDGTGTFQLRIGEKVKAAHVRLYTGGASGYDALLLYPANGS